jgi:hypothetical protein
MLAQQEYRPAWRAEENWAAKPKSGEQRPNTHIAAHKRKGAICRMTRPKGVSFDIVMLSLLGLAVMGTIPGIDAEVLPTLSHEVGGGWSFPWATVIGTLICALVVPKLVAHLLRSIYASNWSPKGIFRTEFFAHNLVKPSLKNNK